MKVFKYRLYPTRKQITALNKQVEAHRQLYNNSLAERIKVYKETGKGINYYHQANNLKNLRATNVDLANCNFGSLQQTLIRLDKAYQNFFRRIKKGEKAGFPRFKSVDRFNSISFGSIGDGCQIKKDKLYIQNVGHIEVNWHRPIDGKIKTLCISRSNNKWYVSFFVEYTPKKLRPNKKIVGIDIGIENFATLSDKTIIPNPKFFKQSEKSLVKIQRQLSKCEKGSLKWQHKKRTLAKIYEKISNRRHNFVHQEARKIINKYGTICVEDLNIRDMQKNKYLSKSIADTSWGMFIKVLADKAEEAGRRFIKVPAQGTSQICSKCGTIVPKRLSVRIHRCNVCGLNMHRDLNASFNILSLGLQGLGATPLRSRLLQLAE